MVHINITTVCLYIFNQDLVIKMLHVDPHQRLTAPQVLYLHNMLYKTMGPLQYC